MQGLTLAVTQGDPRRIEAVSFDLWETLIELRDYTEARHAFLSDLLAKRGQPRDPDRMERARLISKDLFETAWLEQHRSLSARVRLEHMLDSLEVQLGEEDLGGCVAHFEETILEDPPALLPQAEELLSWLRSRARVILVCDSGITPGRVLRQVLERRRVLHLFDQMVFSDEMGFSKPEPEMFLRPLRQIRVSPDSAVHIGDNPRTDICGALAAGLLGVWLNRRPSDILPPQLRPTAVVHSLWGFRSLFLEPPRAHHRSSIPR